MAYIDFISKLHNRTKRNYLERGIQHNKAACAQIAKKFDKDYWDGDRKYGYGGFRYDGRWKVVAEEMITHYGLTPGQSILDIGCGKGFLIHEFTQILPGLKVSGLDISPYALENAKEEVKPFLRQGLAQELPYEDNFFDLVISITTLHNLYLPDLKKALQEIERVSRKYSYIVVDSYRNEEEKVNLMYWQLTCECFFTPDEWEWLLNEFGFTGDYEFIYFE